MTNYGGGHSSGMQHMLTQVPSSYENIVGAAPFESYSKNGGLPPTKPASAHHSRRHGG